MQPMCLCIFLIGNDIDQNSSTHSHPGLTGLNFTHAQKKNAFPSNRINTNVLFSLKIISPFHAQISISGQI